MLFRSDAVNRIKQAEMIMARATEAGNGEDVVAAMRIRDEAMAQAQQLQAAKQQTVVKDEWSKTPRNAPCPCGSGKKFKMCHGATL